MLQHFICDPIRSQSLLLLHLFQCFFKLLEGQAFGHAWVKASTSCVGTVCVKVLKSLTLSAEGEAVLSSSKTLARTFAATFPVTTPFMVCSVVLPCSDLSQFSDFVSCQSFWESLSMLRDAVFIVQLTGFVFVSLCLNQLSAGSVFSLIYCTLLIRFQF